MPPLRHVERRLDAESLRDWPLPDDDGDDKHGRGTVLVVGGTVQTPGAAVLAGTAALRAGAGRLQIATDAAALAGVAAAVPEARVVAVDDDLGHLVASAAAVVVGPGLDAATAHDVVWRVLSAISPATPLVVDAAALRALADGDPPTHPDLVLTPNREELDVLAPSAPDALRAVAERFGATTISFGRVVTSSGVSYVDASAVRGLGTSGAGDVLAGAVGGLAARCGDGAQAACWAALSHRRAAARLTRRIAPIGYLARELADELAPALAALAG
jgi:ADP-dependent NAD(P)H-hydrate dehydratase